MSDRPENLINQQSSRILENYMKKKKFFYQLAAAVLTLLPIASFSAQDKVASHPTTKSSSRHTSFQIIDPYQYKAFVENWDSAQNPVKCAVMRNSAEWQAVMHPAPVMFRAAQQFSPPDTFFQQKQILLIARVLPGDKHNMASSIFKVSKITTQSNTTTISYTYQAPTSESSYQVNYPLLLAIPQMPNKKHYFKFVENGRTVCTLQKN